MPLTHVVIPFAGDCEHREAALEWVLGLHDSPVTVSAVPLPWVKAHAVMPAVERLPAETIVVVADADVWSEGIGESVAAVADGAVWSVPHRRVHRLTAAETAAVLAGAEPEIKQTDEKPYLGVAGGGIVVARRETLLECPLDPRFIGFGCEDASWGCALTTLHGYPHRVSAPLIHLWHPPQMRPGRLKAERPQSHALQHRYLAAAGNRSQTRALIEEVR